MPDSSKKNKSTDRHETTLSRQEIRERRRQVQKLSLAGLGLRDIARTMGIRTKIVQKDLDYNKYLREKMLSKTTHEMAVNEALASLKMVEQEAWEQYYQSKPGSVGRVQFLNTIKGAQNDKLKLLADIGVVEKASKKIDHTVTALPPSAQLVGDWSTKTKQLVAMAIIRSQLAAGQSEKGNGHAIKQIPEEIIDAISTPVKASDKAADEN